MKIYDCFTFYNELDLLHLRLDTLYNHVDYFVIVEANTTFTNKRKHFVYEKAIARFKPFADKIIHVKVENMPGNQDAWVNDRFQRDQIFRGIENADPDDLIMVSDLDEIIRPAAVDYMRNSNQTLFALRMPLYNFKFNYMKVSPDVYNIWGMAGRRHLFNDIKPDAFRALRFQFMNAPYQFRNDGCEVIEHGGWHFGYMGDRNWLVDKAQAFAHTEVNTPEFLAQIDPEASIAKRTSWQQDSNDRYTIVELDNYFPEVLQSNTTHYTNSVLPNPEAKALDFLPPYPYNN